MFLKIKSRQTIFIGDHLCMCVYTYLCMCVYTLNLIIVNYKKKFVLWGT